MAAGTANLGVTSIYLQGIDSGEIIETVQGRGHQSYLQLLGWLGSRFRSKQRSRPGASLTAGFRIHAKAEAAMTPGVVDP
jgi:hypothetical protein